jgi:hypothetical protein
LSPFRSDHPGIFSFPPDLSFADAVFDGMMLSRAAIYKQQQTLDSYGNLSSSIFIQLATSTIVNGVVTPVGLVPCGVRNMKGEELNTPPAPASQTSHGIQEFIIYMRVIQVDSPPVPLNIKHWLQLLSPAQLASGAPLLDPNNPNAGAVMYNITNASDPYQLGHHLEVAATVISP